MLEFDFIKNDDSGFFKLHGAYENRNDTTFTIDNWWSRQYQQKKSEYLNDHFILRGLLVKGSNQYNYSFYNEINAEEIFECKNGYFFRFYWEDFKPSYNFKGMHYIDSLTNQIRDLQHILDSSKTKLICVIAPDKARLYPEYLTENYKENESLHPNNYQAFLKNFKEKNINHIDFNNWYQLIKDTFDIPIFTKNGVHWTQSASAYAIDSMQKYMEYHSKKDFPNIVLKNKHFKIRPWQPDVDASEIMNLLWAPNEVDIPYFNASVDDSTLSKPKVLVISDSFWDAPSWSGYDKLLFEKQEYWYYNRTLRNYVDPERPINEKDYLNLDQYDYIVVLATETNLSEFGWGFFNRAIQAQQK